MYAIKTCNHNVELKAKARYYREFKLAIGCDNLKKAFFQAFSTLDVDFLAKWIVCFAVDRTVDEATAYDVLDECLDEGRVLYDLYSDCSEFLNGMGFFGKLGLSENASTISYFEDQTNLIDMDEKIATALNGGITDIVNRMVVEQLSQEN